MTAINAQGYRQVAVLRVWFGVDGSDLEDVSESTKYEMGMNQILDLLKVTFHVFLPLDSSPFGKVSFELLTEIFERRNPISESMLDFRGVYKSPFLSIF